MKTFKAFFIVLLCSVCQAQESGFLDANDAMNQADMAAHIAQEKYGEARSEWSSLDDAIDELYEIALDNCNAADYLQASLLLVDAYKHWLDADKDLFEAQKLLNSGDGLYEKGMNALGTGDYAAAIIWFSLAELDYAKSETHVALAEQDLDKGWADYDAAREIVWYCVDEPEEVIFNP